jgi:hypothetical protein
MHRAVSLSVSLGRVIKFHRARAVRTISTLPPVPVFPLSEVQRVIKAILSDSILEEAHMMASDTGSSGTNVGGPIIIDGKTTADQIREELRVRVATLVASYKRVRRYTADASSTVHLH